MSINIKGVAQRALASLTMTSTVLGLAGFAALTPTVALAVVPADYGLLEGDTISAQPSDPDIFIVNDWGFKRLFVNPAIFTLYGHLSWAGVKTVAPATRDAFGTSGLFRNCETGAQNVYGLEVVSEDVAVLHWINITGAQAVIEDPMFFRKVFCINTAEQNLYGVGAPYTSLNQVPVYNKQAAVFVNFLARGSEGFEVIALQQKLKDLGFFPQDVTINGFFGPATESAVKAFQQANGISPTGYVGPATRERLNQY